MKTTFLEFEQPIAELEAKIEELRFVQDDSAVDIADEINRLQKKGQTLVKDTYAKLTPWQVAQVARHPQRPWACPPSSLPTAASSRRSIMLGSACRAPPQQ